MPADRLHVRLWILAFALSCAIPVWASLDPSPPRVLPPADLALAAAVALHGFALWRRARSRPVPAAEALARLQLLASLPLGLMLLYFVVAPRLDWEILLIGLGWRSWLLAALLPSLLALEAARPDNPARNPPPDA